MNYEITLPHAMINCPGPGKLTKFLSSCLWLYGSGNGNRTFFSYDILNTFVFGVNSGTFLAFTINGFSGYRYV